MRPLSPNISKNILRQIDKLAVQMKRYDLLDDLLLFIIQELELRLNVGRVSMVYFGNPNDRNFQIKSSDKQQLVDLDYDDAILFNHHLLRDQWNGQKPLIVINSESETESATEINDVITEPKGYTIPSSFISYPLIDQEMTMGILIAEGYDGPRKLTGRDLQFIELLGPKLAFALKNTGRN